MVQLSESPFHYEKQTVVYDSTQTFDALRFDPLIVNLIDEGSGAENENAANASDIVHIPVLGVWIGTLQKEQ